MTSGIVVSSILFPSDELLWVEKLPVWAISDLIWKGTNHIVRAQTTRPCLAGTSLPQCVSCGQMYGITCPSASVRYQSGRNPDLLPRPACDQLAFFSFKPGEEFSGPGDPGLDTKKKLRVTFHSLQFYPFFLSPITVGSKSTKTARGTCFPAPVSQKKVVKESSPPPMVLSLGICPSG